MDFTLHKKKINSTCVQKKQTCIHHFIQTTKLQTVFSVLFRK